MNTYQLPLGPVMVGVAGLSLTDEDIIRLRHPLVGGVILFRRNFESVEQLKLLTQTIKQIRQPELLIAVDHEGGRVQRFIDGFTRLPAMATLGQLYHQDPSTALDAAHEVGEVLATELVAAGLDLSFTPVLDLDWGKCAVIGNRSFDASANVVMALAGELLAGLQQGGMSSCGKHFPGHGFVSGDSHLEMPVDTRTLEELLEADILPFKAMIQSGLGSVMPAHVVYPKVAAEPAGFSKVWLKSILRDMLHFEGMIFSDDLGMEGAASAGSFVARAQIALEAGCDMVLECNRPDKADEILAGLSWQDSSVYQARIDRLKASISQETAQSVMRSVSFQAKQKRVAALVDRANCTGGPSVGEVND